MDTSHTFSDVSLRGQGIRGALAEEAVAVIRKKCRRCMAFSPYTLVQAKKHEKEQDIWMKGGPR